MSSKKPNSDNRAWWNQASEDYQRTHGVFLGDAPDAWGTWRWPESSLGVLGDVEGKDVLEFGCGAAQWSIALAHRGARTTGTDISEHQLAYARNLVGTAGVDVALVQANAEATPFSDASFDIVFCDHGAMSFARPRHTVLEASRILRPGGRFAFCMSSPIRDLCFDQQQAELGRRLERDYFDLNEIEDEGVVCYQLPYGAWIRLFRRCSLVIEDLLELTPPTGATTTYEDFAPLGWARRWPAEHIWKLRKR